MTRTILVLSGKGGVGKTTLVSNLAYALAGIGEDVIAIDANLTTPNLGLHTGMPLTPHTLHDALKGNVDLGDAIYTHSGGFRIIPASMSMGDLMNTDPSRLAEVTMELLGKTDYVLIDSSAGLGRETISAIQASDEVLIVVNPSMPSVVDALKAAEITRKLGKKVLGIAVNRRKWKAHELSNRQIESMIEAPILAEIPEDENVARSISLKQSVIEYDSRSPASVAINKLAHKMAGQTFEYESPRPNILDRMVGWLTR